MEHRRSWLVARVVFCAAIAVCLAAALALASFAAPNGDEFCVATLSPVMPIPGWQRATSVPAYAVDHWMFVSGRWLTFIVGSFIIRGVDLTRDYTYLVLLVWLTLLSAFFLFAKLLLRGSRRSFILAVGFGLWLLFWFQMPGPGDGFFWFYGAFQNLTPFTVDALLFLALAAVARSHGLKARVLLIAAAVSAACVASLHELHGLYLAAALYAGAILLHRSGRREWRAWAICAACATVALAVVVVAPGNFQRAALLPPNRIEDALNGTVKIFVYQVALWVLSLPLLSATLAFLLHARMREVRAAWVDDVLPGWWKAAVPAITVSLIFAGVLVPSFANSGMVQGRTLNGVYVVFLIGWFVSAVVFSRAWPSSDVPPAVRASFGSFCLLVFGLAVVFDGNTRLALIDLRDSAPSWRAAMTERFRILETSATQDTVTVNRPGPTPRLFFAADILETPLGFRNVCVSGYFKVAAVMLKPRTVNNPGSN